MAYLGNTPTSQNFTSGTDYFNGNGSTVAFTLSRQVSSINDVIVVIENVVQKPLDAYGIVGTTLTFTSAPPSGTNNIYVRYVSTITTAITPNDLSVTTNKIADGVVTTAKVADNHITVEKLHTAVLQPANISDKNNTSTGYFDFPSGTTAQRPGTPTGGMWRFNNTTNYNEYWDPTNSTWISVGAFTAIGGTVTSSGGYNYHTFTSSGTFQVIVGSKSNAIVMVIAGGGSGGGAGGTDGAGAGGAGGLVYATNVTFNTGSYAITVGAGAAGVGVGVRGTQGNNSSIGGTSIATAIGGGLGGAETGGARAGDAGGSGGGGGGYSAGGGSGTAGQGNSGAIAQTTSGGGGGGGAGAATTNRNGGNGLQYLTIATATSTGADNGYYAGGGGGSGDPRAFVAGGTGGVGGGGAGAPASSGGTPVNGTTNTGGGGGGSAGTTPVGSTKISGNGGSGLVIIAYPYP